MTKKINNPKLSAINTEVEIIEADYFDTETKPEKKRGNAFQYMCYSLICDVDEVDIDDEDIVDGSDEEGIDIINVQEFGDEGIVRIINCKSSFKDDFSASELTKIREGLRFIFEADKSEISKLNNLKLQNQINAIRKNKRAIKGIELYYVVFNGKNIQGNVKRKIDEIISHYSAFLKSSYPDAEFSLQLLSGEDLYDLKVSREESLRGITVKIPFFDTSKRESPVETTIEGIAGFVTTLPGKEIAKLVKKYDDKLFDKNIRGWLRYNTVNKDILEAATSENSNMFWFMNNGITFIADDVFPENDDKKWFLTNPQIVNGQQTARMLFEAMKSKSLKKDVKVLCRIYKAKNTKFIQNIVKATNTQTSIGLRDLVSNDTLQKAIQEEFEKYGYFYQRQRYESTPSTDFKETITSMKIAQVGLAVLLAKPSLARKNNQNIFFNENKYYEDIFIRNPEELLLVYLLYRYCEEHKKESVPVGYFGVLHISRIIWYFKKKDFEVDLHKSINEFEQGKILIKKEYTKALKILQEILNDQKIDKENYKSYLSSIEVDELIFKKLT